MKTFPFGLFLMGHISVFQLNDPKSMNFFYNFRIFCISCAVRSMMEPRLKVKIKYFIYKIFITISGCQKYEQEFQQSIKNPEEYWGKIAEDIVWTKKWQKVLDDSASPFTKWFVGGRLSLCYNALGKIQKKIGAPLK